jgi:heterodisulfide reductase subunit A
VTQPILIVGGGPAGLAAASALASIGQHSIVVEKAPRLGGAPILTGYAKLVPSGEWAKDAIGGMVSRVEDDPLVTRHTGCTVTEFSGSPGAFRARLSNGASLDVGAAILCTGFTHFDSVNKPEWGFGTYPDVVTTAQVEQMISSGKGVRCPSDGRKPERVAILLCVGSRDRQIGREWCSKICCTVSCNIAMEIREELPDCHVYIYYMDIRTYGLYEMNYYWRSQEEFKVKYIKARIAEVTSNGDKLIVKGEDTLVKRPITIPFDMVIHAIGMDPNVDNKTIASVFGIGLQPQGFIGKGNAYGALGETSRPGVFVAGAATGPETIDDSIAQAKAAAIAAFALAAGAAARAEPVVTDR